MYMYFPALVLPIKWPVLSRNRCVYLINTLRHTHTHTYTHAHKHTHTHTHMYTHTGEPITFPLSIRPARNFPFDLYLLMDLSFSMRDDLDNLKRLGANLGMLPCGSISRCLTFCIMFYTHLRQTRMANYT